MSKRTKGWRKDVESGSMDRLLDAVWEAIEAVESMEGGYIVRGKDVKAAEKILNTHGDTLADCREILRTLIGHAERPES